MCLTTNELHDIKKIFKKGLLFVIPLLLLIFFPLSILIYTGELYPTGKVIQEQLSGNKILFGLAYRNPAKYYKLQLAIQKRPEIITIGTSRVMQFRAGFFNKKGKFFNAGGGVDRIKELSYFLKQIPEEQEPKIIIVGLDQTFFNTNWYQSLSEKEYLSQSIIESFQYSIPKIYSDYIRGKFSFDNFKKTAAKYKPIGVSAYVKKNGFRNDGSYYYGKIKPIYNVNDGLTEITGSANPTGQFIRGKDVSTVALQDLTDFLKEAKKRSIHIIGFLSPYRQDIYDKMKTYPDRYAYLFKLENNIRPIFTEYKFPFYNFSDLSSFGANDDEMLDSSHGTEKLFLKILIEITKNDSILEKYIDIARLKDLLSKAKNNYLIFDDY